MLMMSVFARQGLRHPFPRVFAALFVVASGLTGPVTAAEPVEAGRVQPAPTAAVPASAEKPAPTVEEQADSKPAAAIMYHPPEWLHLDDYQQRRVTEIAEGFRPRFVACLERSNDLLTAEQKQTRARVVEESTAAGLPGSAIVDAVDAALALSEDQQAEVERIRKEVRLLNWELRILTHRLLDHRQRAMLRRAAREAETADPETPAEQDVVKKTASGV